MNKPALFPSFALLCVARDDLQESGLGTACFDAISSLMQYSASDCYNTVGECTHQFLQRLEETLSVQVRSPASPLAVLACAAVLHHNGPFTPSPPLFVFVSRMCSGANGRAIQGAACDPGIYLPSAAGQCVRVHAHECQFLLLRYFVFLIIYLRFLSPTRCSFDGSHVHVFVELVLTCACVCVLVCTLAFMRPYFFFCRLAFKC